AVILLAGRRVNLAAALALLAAVLAAAALDRDGDLALPPINPVAAITAPAVGDGKLGGEGFFAAHGGCLVAVRRRGRVRLSGLLTWRGAQTRRRTRRLPYRSIPHGRRMTNRGGQFTPELAAGPVQFSRLFQPPPA